MNARGLLFGRVVYTAHTLILRHCPEDLHASVFTNRLRDRVEFIQRSLTAAVDGLELLQVCLVHDEQVQLSIFSSYLRPRLAIFLRS